MQSNIDSNKAAIETLEEKIDAIDPNSGGWNEVS